jgi:hypothetical protein
VSWPGWRGAPATREGVRLNRGAGPGCITPSTCTKVWRDPRCGTLDAQDLGTHLPKQHAGEGSRPDPAQLKHAEADERPLRRPGHRVRSHPRQAPASAAEAVATNSPSFCRETLAVTLRGISWTSTTALGIL